MSSLSVAEIRKLVAGPGGAGEELLKALEHDPRAGAREIYHRLNRAKAALAAEVERLNGMFRYEDEVKAKGFTPVAGVDEAGRGPLAGPVMAAAVILPDRARLFDLNDSKKLTAARREALAGQIKKVALAWAIGMSTVEEIYNENIYHASLTAMRRAVMGLKIRPAYVLVDGYK
ncbi:MAG: ribonuclease HII, partial [Firmicutes bacterium]|nr:ribonuclease HII [Bacillota bacterium]